MVEFVNPYTFVPHEAEPVRSRPRGHAAAGSDGFSGVFSVRLTVKTPLVIGGYKDETTDVSQVPRLAARDGVRGMPIIPGSGLLGAVRSVHETLAGGCLRVLNADFLPVHRHPASTQETNGLRLAVVSEADGSGMPLAVRLCEEWVRVPVAAVTGLAGRLPTTGDQLLYKSPAGARGAAIPVGAIASANGRRTVLVKREEEDKGIATGSLVAVAGMRPVTEDRWVLLVSDTRPKKADLPLYFAAGRFSPGGLRYTVTRDTWDKYRDTVDGADDLRPAVLASDQNKNGDEPSYDPAAFQPVAVQFPPDDGPEVACRLPARRYLYRGQPVWVKIDEHSREVTEIRLSMLWRYQGTGTAGQRAGLAVPCRNPESLCWSCRLFGSADTVSRDKDDAARQRAYRGHVRFEDLVATHDFDPVTWHLAPLSSPRPGAGQFYLDSKDSRNKLSEQDTRPAATWGSDADQPRRPIRGRKYYWRTTDPTGGEHPRGRFRAGHQSAALGKRVQLVPAGTVFTGKVRFDNLSAADYGSLLAALNPRLLAGVDDPGWAETVTSVGGARPFGFGAVYIDIEEDPGPLAQTARMRYLGEDGDTVSAAEAVRAFHQEVATQAYRGVYRSWASLRHALTFGYVSDDLVWYPAVKGQKGEKAFDESFEFFAETNGVKLKNRDKKLVELPKASGSPGDQVIRWPVRGNRNG